MRLAASLRYSLYGLVVALLASGIVWLAVHYFDVVSDDARAWTDLSMRIHGAAAMATLVVVGVAIALHVARAWRERKNRISGVFLAAVLFTLTFTGYLLYYAGGEAARAAASAVHWIIGLCLPLLLVAHVYLGRTAPTPGTGAD
jgi:hypothetical protein